MAHMKGGIRTGSSTQMKRHRPNTQSLDGHEEQAGEAFENVGYTERIFTGLAGGQVPQGAPYSSGKT